MASETVIVPGTADEWKEFDYADYDPAAEGGGKDDTFGDLMAEGPEEEGNKVGIVIVCEPLETVDPSLIKRLAGALIPSKVRYESRGGGKVGEKKKSKHKKD